MLRPGMDFREGRAYYTIPLTRNMVRMTRVRRAKTRNPFTTRNSRPTLYQAKARASGTTRKALTYVASSPSNRSIRNEKVAGPSHQRVHSSMARPPPPPQLTSLPIVRDIYTVYARIRRRDILRCHVAIPHVYVCLPPVRVHRIHPLQRYDGVRQEPESLHPQRAGIRLVWASSMSAPSLYRKLAGSPGTTLLDESEGFEGERGEELRRVLNAGYKDGAKAIRTEKSANSTGTCQSSTTYSDRRHSPP